MSTLVNKSTKVICQGITGKYLLNTYSVIPAKAGIPLCMYDQQKRDPSFRWGDVLGVR